MRFRNTRILLDADAVRHTINRHGGTLLSEQGNGQVAINDAAGFAKIIAAIKDFDTAKAGDVEGTVELRKKVDHTTLVILAEKGKGTGMLRVVTAFAFDDGIKAKKESDGLSRPLPKPGLPRPKRRSGHKDDIPKSPPFCATSVAPRRWTCSFDKTPRHDAAGDFTPAALG